jgi:hypothetical protein
MTIESLLSLTPARQSCYGLYRFSNLNAAQGMTERSQRPMFVMLGDDDKFWVVSGRIAQQLEKLGYEFAG